MPSVIVVDDVPAARRVLIRLLQAHPDVRVLGEAESVAGARALLGVETPDAVLLDVEMPEGNGFELIQSLRAETRVIFITAHMEHAPLAFEVEALDYVLKPVRAPRLAQALDRLRRAYAERVNAANVPPAPHLSLRDHLCLNTNGRTMIVPVDRIVALQAEGDFTRFYIEGQPSILMGYTLGRYEPMLPAPPFARISRSLMIHLTRVKTLTSASRDESRLKLDGLAESFELGRVAAVRLKSLLQS